MKGEMTPEEAMDFEDNVRSIQADLTEVQRRLTQLALDRKVNEARKDAMAQSLQSALRYLEKL